MKKLTNKTIFQCSFCTKVSLSAAGIYSHEIYCKKNPHNHILCSSCAQCEKKEWYGEKGTKCEHCCYGEDIYGDSSYSCNDCDSRQKYIEFICKADGKKMYSPKIGRMKRSVSKDIISSCDKPMADEMTGCPMYENEDIFCYGNDEELKEKLYCSNEFCGKCEYWKAHKSLNCNDLFCDKPLEEWKNEHRGQAPLTEEEINERYGTKIKEKEQ